MGERRMTAAVESMMYAKDRGVPWHQLGTSVEHAPTSREAFKQAGLDWLIESKPLYVEVGDGEFMEVPAWANVRLSDNSFLGVVTDRYEAFQNWEMFEFLDSLVADGVMRYETAGSLFNGKKVWALGRLQEDWRIGDDEYKNYMLMSAGHDGKTGVFIQPTEIRVVCNNTLTQAIGRNGQLARFGFKHFAGLRDHLAQARQALNITTEASRKMKEWLERSLKFDLNENQVRAVTFELFGDPLEEEGGTKVRLLNRIDTFAKIYDEEASYYGNTGYSMMNAITGYADHYLVYRGLKEDKGFLRTERRLDGIMGGRSAAFKEVGIRTLQEIGVK